eukprot:TRINITY_DN7634_c0_g1_i1.p4 TRINITY_DN7634_c0_g1~~TRINITY_DN7634_c0_g1_i1.p4  ORF type:complete len:120 (-),score=36.20 TRINITY_DN7634_c0_g1_i1:395-754(-)
MWSFYFVILDFLNEMLPWRACKDNKPDDVKDHKMRCLEFPELYLWKTTANVKEIKSIFRSIKRLEYADRPDYAYIRQELTSLLRADELPREPKSSLISNVFRGITLAEKETPGAGRGEA